jgi:hypothetical protein
VELAGLAARTHSSTSRDHLGTAIPMLQHGRRRAATTTPVVQQLLRASLDLVPRHLATVVAADHLAGAEPRVESRCKAPSDLHRMLAASIGKPQSHECPIITITHSHSLILTPTNLHRSDQGLDQGLDQGSGSWWPSSSLHCVLSQLMHGTGGHRVAENPFHLSGLLVPVGMATTW